MSALLLLLPLAAVQKLIQDVPRPPLHDDSIPRPFPEHRLGQPNPPVLSNSLSRVNFIRWTDSLRHSPLVRELAGWLALLRARFQRTPTSAASWHCRALDLANSTLLQDLALASLTPHLNDTDLWHKVVSGLPRYRTLIPTQPALTRSIILKSPGPNGEKGALLLYFEYNWARFLLGLPPEDRAWFHEHYDIILTTSWSPTDYAALALACSIFPGVIWVQPANRTEAQKIASFHPRLHVLDSLACDWVNPNFYQPKPFAHRTIDLIMIANWGHFKRHWEFFQALTHLPHDLRIVLIGQQEGGRTLDTIRAEARSFQVPQAIEFYESLPIDQVTALQCDAKVSVLMSRREGGCVAAVESLFAGCALAMRSDAHVGSRAHINPQTGTLLRPGHIAQDLLQLLKLAPTLHPREWAIQNIACQQTTAKLNHQLKSHALAENRPWTRDLALANWHPHPTFANPSDQQAMLPAYTELHHRFPTLFSADLHQLSWR